MVNVNHRYVKIDLHGFFPVQKLVKSSVSQVQTKGISTLSAMRKSEANRRRMLLSHRARNDCSPSANSHLHARWRPTMHFPQILYVARIWI